MSLIVVLIILVILFGGVGYGYNRGSIDGRGLGGILGTILIIVLIWYLLGKPNL